MCWCIRMIKYNQLIILFIYCFIHWFIQQQCCLNIILKFRFSLCYSWIIKEWTSAYWEIWHCRIKRGISDIWHLKDLFLLVQLLIMLCYVLYEMYYVQPYVWILCPAFKAISLKFVNWYSDILQMCFAWLVRDIL